MHAKVKRIIAALAYLCLFALPGTTELYAQESDYISLSHPVILPDGSEFKSWREQTIYTRTYYVDQSHLRACDDNDGSEEKPFLTINKAAQTIQAGEKVVVKSGAPCL